MAAPSNAPLLEVSASDISATYYRFTGVLELKAKGTEPPFWLGPFFQRETLLGGLLFSIRAQPSLGPAGMNPPPNPFDISFSEHITLPELHFNSKSVGIETAQGTWNIAIEYVGFFPGGGSSTILPVEGDEATAASTSNDTPGNINRGQVTKDVLPPVSMYLAGGGATLKLTALVPTVPAPGQAFVNVRYSSDWFTMVNSTHEAGVMTWTFKWTKTPTDGKPQDIEVATTTTNGLFGASSVVSEIKQGYIVHLVFLTGEDSSAGPKLPQGVSI